jgi:hypothetical protein
VRSIRRVIRPLLDGPLADGRRRLSHHKLVEDVT